MTKDQLKAWLVGMAGMFQALQLWMFGPLAWVKTILAGAAAFFVALANSDSVLDYLVSLINSGALVIPHHAMTTPAPHQVAMLSAPSEKHLEQFTDAVPESFA